MDGQYLTQPALAECSQIGSQRTVLSPMHAKPQPARSYDAQLDLDGGAVVRNVKKKLAAPITNGKWVGWSTEARCQYLEKEIETELKKRESGKHTTTARFEYPEIWGLERDQKTQDWVRKLQVEAMKLSRTSSSQAVHEDRDDEEVRAPANRIKGEGDKMRARVALAKQFKATKRALAERGFTEDSDDESSLSEMDSADERQLEDATQGKAKESNKQGGCSKSFACSRGLAMKLSVEGEGKEGIQGIARRYWKWVDTAGGFVEWPPL